MVALDSFSIVMNMNRIRIASKAGYYRISLYPTPQNARLFRSNMSRAFIVAQLQELLAVRTILEEPLAKRFFASHIDLLAFSLLTQRVELVIFSISYPSALQFSEVLVRRIQEYTSEQLPSTKIHTEIHRLSGPHGALARSITLHLEHTDWENDRYSSIGFYLHDRRGDWMRLWRLADLFENNPENYRALLELQQLTETDSLLRV